MLYFDASDGICGILTTRVYFFSGKKKIAPQLIQNSHCQHPYAMFSK